jgi:large subunit ribosomal protein L17
MHHAKTFRKLSRTPSHRRALMRNMATDLIKREQIETTLAKAKDLKRVAEKLVTLAKVDSLAKRRQAYAYLKCKGAVHKLFVELAPKYISRPGGYTRVVRTRYRVGDAAEMAVICFVTEEAKKKTKRVKKEATKAAE